MFCRGISIMLLVSTGTGCESNNSARGNHALRQTRAPAKQKDDSAAVEIDRQGERDEGDERTACSKEKFGALVKNADEECGADQGQAPPASAQLPAVLSPDAKSEDDAGRRDEHADRTQRIGGPASPEQSELAFDAEAACRGKKADGAPKHDGWRRPPARVCERSERCLIGLRCREGHLLN
jgi:hypothetical protein